jgi:hypothetical protein
MNTDVIEYGNLDFISDKVKKLQKDESIVIMDGIRMVLWFIIHKNTLRAVENKESFRLQEFIKHKSQEIVKQNNIML